VYLLKFWRDAIKFSLLIQATQGSVGMQAQYSQDVKTMASQVMRIFKLKCAIMVTNAYSYTIHNDEDTDTFPVSRKMAATVIEQFKAAAVMDSIPVGQWPVYELPRFKRKTTAVHKGTGIDWPEMYV
jgi:hypothetical protein